jgi:hypothetical protein
MKMIPNGHHFLMCLDFLGVTLKNVDAYFTVATSISGRSHRMKCEPAAFS